MANFNNHQPLKIAESLRVTQELSKIDVEQMAGSFQHNIVVMSITDT